MNSSRTLDLCLVGSLLLACCGQPAEADPWTLDQMVGKDREGGSTYRPRPIDSRLNNPISEEDEDGFSAAGKIRDRRTGQAKVPAGNTYFENEKRTYGLLMAQVLAGRGRRQGPATRGRPGRRVASRDRASTSTPASRSSIRPASTSISAICSIRTTAGGCSRGPRPGPPRIPCGGRTTRSTSRARAGDPTRRTVGSTSATPRTST